MRSSVRFQQHDVQARYFSYWGALAGTCLTLLSMSPAGAQTQDGTPLSTPSVSATPSPQISHKKKRALPSVAQTVEVTPTFTPTVTSVPSPGDLKKMTLEQLMNLDVTSVSKQPQPYGQAPAAIDVITNDEIRRSGASSIPEALRLADNLEVAQKGSDGWSISARGFNTDLSNKLLVLMDGRTVYSPLFSGVFWNIQDYLLEDIDRIEVISGPGGTLWGANAVNGVINITSKSAKDTQGLYLEGGGGTELQDFEGIRYGGTLGSNIYYRVYGKYFARGPENTINNNTPAMDSWEMGQGGFRIDAEPSSMETFTLQGDVYDGDANVPTGGNSNMNGNNIIGRWSRTFEDDSNVSLQLYWDRTYLYDPIPETFLLGFEAAPAGVLTDSLDTYDASLQYAIHLDDHNNLTTGLGYRFTHDITENAPGLAFNPTLLDQSLYNAFVQDEIAFYKDVIMTVGSKVEHNDYTGYEFEPSGRIKWDMTDTQMLWFAVSRAVRTPSMVEENESEPAPKFPVPLSAILTGSSASESETLIAYELGYRAQIGPKVSSSISAFFNNYDDIRSTGITPTGLASLLPFVFQNGLQAQTGGFELTTDYQMLDWLRWHAGYDLLQENIWVKPGNIDVNKGLNETADPKNQVFLRASVDLPGHMEFDPAFRWVDSLTYNANGGTPAIVPSYAELDARLGWHVTPAIELSVVGQNLLHYEHVEYAPSGSAPQEQVGRSVYGKVSCKF